MLFFDMGRAKGQVTSGLSGFDAVMGTGRGRNSNRVYTTQMQADAARQFYFARVECSQREVDKFYENHRYIFGPVLIRHPRIHTQLIELAQQWGESSIEYPQAKALPYEIVKEIALSIQSIPAHARTGAKGIFKQYALLVAIAAFNKLKAERAEADFTETVVGSVSADELKQLLAEPYDFYRECAHKLALERGLVDTASTPEGAVGAVRVFTAEEWPAVRGRNGWLSVTRAHAVGGVKRLVMEDDAGQLYLTEEADMIRAWPIAGERKAMPAGGWPKQ